MVTEFRNAEFLLRTGQMEVEAHVAELTLKFFCDLNSLIELFLLSAVALGEDNLKIFAHLVEHLDEHAVGILKTVDCIYENHDHLVIARRCIFEVVFNESAPLQDIVL